MDLYRALGYQKWAEGEELRQEVGRGDSLFYLQEDVRRVGDGEDDAKCGEGNEGEGVDLQHAGADVSEKKGWKRIITLKKASWCTEHNFPQKN